MFPAMPNLDPMTLAALMRGQGGQPNLAPPPLSIAAPRPGMAMPMMQPPAGPAAPAAGGGMTPMAMMALAQMMKGNGAPGYRQFPNSPYGASPGGGATYMPPGAPGAGGGGLSGLLGLFGGGAAPSGGYPGLGGG